MERIPTKISLLGIALLVGLMEQGGTILSNILEGPRFGLGRGLDRLAKHKTLWEYYEILKTMNERSARTILWRLTKKGLVKKEKKRYFISKLGLKFIEKHLLEPEQKEWDGRWRLVAFDIPEKIAHYRKWLRSQLYALNYKPLQKSLFIGKFPLEKKLMEEILEKNLYQCIRIVVIGEIDDESILENL